MSFPGNSSYPLTMFLQSMLQNSTTGQIRICNVGCCQGTCINRRGTKTGATVWCMKWIKVAQVYKWISSNLGFEQSGKSTLSLLVVEKATSLAWMFVLVSKNYFWLSRRNGTIWFLVGEMGLAAFLLIMATANWPFCHLHTCMAISHRKLVLLLALI